VGKCETKEGQSKIVPIDPPATRWTMTQNSDGHAPHLCNCLFSIIT
jgi:hypothetical protein